MKPETILRGMTAADLSQVTGLAGALSNVPHWPAQSWESAIRPPNIAMAAEEGGAIQGFAVARIAADVAELETLAVVPASRRRGIARQLMAALLVELRAAAATELWLEVRVSNAPAIALYRSLGFQETGRRAAYYADPAEDAVLMRVLVR